MSAFIPYKSVYAEWVQQQKRLAHGLKTGTHVYYPDSVRGPFILSKAAAEKQRETDKDLNPEQQQSLLGRLFGKSAPVQAPKTKLATGGYHKPPNRSERRKLAMAKAKEEQNG